MLEGQCLSDSSSIIIPDEIALELSRFVHIVLLTEPYEVPGISDQGLEYADYIQSLHPSEYCLDDQIVTALKTLWAEPAIRKMYDLRKISGIEDSTAYFWNNLDTIADHNYIPDLADITCVRKPTKGTDAVLLRLLFSSRSGSEDPFVSLCITAVSRIIEMHSGPINIFARELK